MKKKILIIIAVVLLLAGLGFLLFPPVSNFIGKQIAKGQAEAFDYKISHMITEDDDGGTGVTEKTYAAALEAKQIDRQGYPVNSSGNRTSDKPVVFKADLDRLRRDSIAYNEDLKQSQGSKFSESRDYNSVSALNLRDYGIYDGIYGYISAPSIDMTLPIYLGTSDENMSYGAAHMTYTSLPLGGRDTNSVAVGHTGYVGRIFFDNIRNFNIGDKIKVRNYWETMTYEVVEMNSFKPYESASAFISEGEDLFTLSTCTPLSDGDYGRFFVKCRRVAEESSEPETTSPTFPAETPATTEENK